MKIGKRLQILRNGEWQWVFCQTYDSQIIITKDRRKAIKPFDLGYFASKYGNEQFRVSGEAPCK